MTLTGSVLWWRFGSGGVRWRSNPRLLKLKAFGLGMCRGRRLVPRKYRKNLFSIERSAVFDYWRISGIGVFKGGDLGGGGGSGWAGDFGDPDGRGAFGGGEFAEFLGVWGDGEEGGPLVGAEEEGDGFGWGGGFGGYRCRGRGFRGRRGGRTGGCSSHHRGRLAEGEGVV